MADPVPQLEKEAEQKSEPQPPAQPISPVAPATGRRPAFKGISIGLTDEELKSPGTVKCILDMLDRAEGECNDLKEFREKFHKSDKQAGILDEQKKANKTNEVMFVVGVGVGCAIIGLAPYFWDKVGTGCGWVTFAVGMLLTIGATLGRILYK